jgi:hypothetical protein
VIHYIRPSTKPKVFNSKSIPENTEDPLRIFAEFPGIPILIRRIPWNVNDVNDPANLVRVQMQRMNAKSTMQIFIDVLSVMHSPKNMRSRKQKCYFFLHALIQYWES